jgi:UrcA family protein
MKNFTHNVRTPVAVALAAITACAALATGARAADVAQVHVKYADLNVNTDAGAAVLYRRIHAAANQVCAMPGDRELVVLAGTKACVDRAIAEAVAAVKSPTLSKLYESKVGISPVAKLASQR